MQTRLHRLYKKRLAQTLQDLPEEIRIVNDQMEDMSVEPPVIKYEEDKPPKENWGGRSVPSYAVAVVDGYNVLLVDNVASPADRLEIYISGVGSYSVNDRNEIEVTSLYALEPYKFDRYIDTVNSRGASERQITEDEVQLVQNILDSNEVGNHVIPPFFKRMDVNLVDENDGLLTDHQLSMPEEYPVGELDDSYSTRPGLDGPGHNLPKIEGRSASKGKSVILAILPTKEACQEIEAEMGDQLLEYPEDLHITLLFLGKEVSDDDMGKIGACVDAVCADHEPLECKMQGLGLFDHEDEHGKRAFYASVDAIGLAKLRADLVDALESSGIDVNHKYDFTPHMTLGYIDPRDDIELRSGSPGVSWVSDSVVLMNGSVVTHFSLGSIEKEAGGFGLSLHEIITPSKGQGGTDNWSDNHETENIEEDVDLKLGEVEAPYSEQGGPSDFRFDDDHKYNIVKGADPKEKEAIGIPDEGMNENGYTEGYSRQDSSIPRDPLLEGAHYGR